MRPIIYVGAIAAAIAIGALVTPPAPPCSVATGAANVWVCAIGSDTGPACIRSASLVSAPAPTTVCQSWGKAWQIACGNDKIGVMSGTYGDQQILADTNCAKGAANPVTVSMAGPVTIDAPAPCPSVSKGIRLGNGAGPPPPSGLTIDGLNQLMLHGGMNIYAGTTLGDTLTLANFKVTHTTAAYACDGMILGDYNNFTMRGVEIGPVASSSSGIDMGIHCNTLGPVVSGVGSTCESGDTPTNVTINSNYIHDVVRDCSFLAPQYQADCTDANNGSHVDGLHIWGAFGLNLTNNRFTDVSGQVIFGDGVNCGQFSNVLIENNMLATQGGNPVIVIGAANSNCNPTGDPNPGFQNYSQALPFMSGYLRVLYNTMSGGAGFDVPTNGVTVYSNATTPLIAGNIGGNDTNCVPSSGGAWTWHQNLWSTATPSPACAGDLPLADPTYVAGPVLNPGSCPAGTYSDSLSATLCWPNVWNLHQQTGSAGVAATDLVYCPPTDNETLPRPNPAHPGACNAGGGETP